MNDFFVPLYINDEIISGMFKIAIERFIEVEKITNKQEVIINSSIPLCELTCGRVLQGNASVQLLQGFTRRSIQEIEKSTISTFIKLIDIIDGNKYLKKIQNENSLVNIEEGDLIEIKCKMKMNSKLKKIQHVIDILEIESALEECAIEKNLNNKYNYKALLNWFKNTLQTVKESKCTKYITEPLFNTDFRGIIPIQNKFSVVDLDCNTHTSMTVIGKVSCVEKNSLNSINPITTESCFDFINDRLSTLLSDELMERLNLEELSEVEIKKHIEIIPIMIYI